MKRTLIVLLVIGFFSRVNSQELKCSDFKEGKFYTFNKNSKGETQKSFIIRELNYQVEYSKEKDSIYVIIKWITDCSARLTYDTNKMSLNKMQQWTQDNNGIVITMTSLEDKCMNYQAIMITSKGGEFGQKGKICIDEN